MKVKQIRCVHSEDHADKWLLFTEDGDVFPYSKNFKDRSVKNWEAQGHHVVYTISENGTFENWIFVD